MDTPNTFPRRLRSRRAFTLIELLVVILIVAILIAVALPSFLGQTAKAQDSVVKQRLTVARTEAKAYWTSQGQSGYPATSAIVPQLNASEPGYSFVEDDSIGNSETGSGFTSAPSTTSTTAIGTFVNPEDANEITFCQRSQSGTVFCLRADETAGLYAIANASQTAAPAASPLSPSSAQAATAMTDVVYASGTGSTVADAEANAVCVLQAATPVADGGTATSTNPGDLSACSAGSYAGWNASPATVSTSSPAPTNTVAPAISGTLPGQLTASPGTWSNATGYNYQWYDCPTASVSFSGCNTISGATNNTYTPTAADGPYVTVAVQGYNASTLGAWTLDPNATAVPAQPVATATALNTYSAGIKPYAVAFSPNGSYLAAVGGGTSGTVTVFQVGSGGTLTSVGTYNAGSTPVSVAYSPDGNHLAVVNQGSNNVEIYSVAGDGSLSAGTTYATASTPVSVAYDPNTSNDYLAVTGYTSGEIQMFPYNASTGTLGAATTTTQTYGPGTNGLAFSPNGNVLAVTNTTKGNVATYTVSGATLTYAGSEGANFGYRVAWSPNGNDLAISLNSANEIEAFGASQSTGAFTSIITTNTSTNGASPFVLAYSPNGEDLAVTNTQGNTLQTYSVAANGALTAVSNVATGGDPQGMAYSPDSKYVAVANETDNNVEMFSVAQ